MQRTPIRMREGYGRRRTSSEIESILEGYRKSGLSQRSFARTVGIGVSTLQLWLRKGCNKVRRRYGRPIKRAGAGVRLVEVELVEVGLGGVASGSVDEKAGYEIELRNGDRLRLASAFHDEEVRRLLGLLREVR